MNKKFCKMIYVFLFVMFASVTVNTAYAQSSSSAEIQQTRTAGKMQKREMKVENNIERLKSKAKSEVERRIKSLTHLITVITSFKKISTVQKNDLETKVQAEIDALTALSAKINADTDIAALRTDKQSIVNDYRIFALFIPQIHIIANVEKLLETLERSNKLADNLEKRIADAGAGTPDAVSMTSTLTSMRAHLQSAKIQAETALTIVSALTPEGSQANKTELLKARSMLKLAHAQLVLARQDAHKIMKALGIKTDERKSLKLSPTP